ncbi:MAG: hypothetical protein ACXWE5_11000 [Actinomycetota bacterium]
MHGCCLRQHGRLLDKAGRSAERVLDEFQSPRVGDWIPMAAKVETTAFKVRAFEHGSWMLWEKPHSTWVWTLTPLAGGITRLVAQAAPRDPRSGRGARAHGTSRGNRDRVPG